MKTQAELKAIARFVAEYATRLMGSGVHTSRVVRNTKRLGEALGVRVIVSAFQKVVNFSVVDDESGEVCTEAADIPPLPISFELNAELSALSWEAYDNRMPLAELRERYREIISRPKMSPRLILLLVGLANGAFCRLFGGSWGAVATVILATLLGMFIRQQMQKRHYNHFIVFMVSAFSASMFASLTLIPGWTPDIAIGTSVLFLIPGVPLINGIIDILEGHTVTGTSRLIQATLLVICIATGLAVPLLLFMKNLL